METSNYKNLAKTRLVLRINSDEFASTYKTLKISVFVYFKKTITTYFESFEIKTGTENYCKQNSKLWYKNNFRVFYMLVFRY